MPVTLYPDRVGIFTTVCERIAKGDTLMAICREDGMPSRERIYDWIEEDQELATRFAQARARGFDAIAESTVAISDDREEDPASRRVRIETRLKLLAKWDPKRYGDKLELSGDKDRPLVVEQVKFGG
jgi:hypothetical protein